MSLVNLARWRLLIHPLYFVPEGEILRASGLSEVSGPLRLNHSRDVSNSDGIMHCWCRGLARLLELGKYHY